MSRVVDKYLALYAEPEARDLVRAFAESRVGRGQEPFEHGLVVPLCGEGAAFLAGIESAVRAAPGVLVVVVVNAEVGAEAPVLEANRRLITQLLDTSNEVQTLGEGAWLLEHPVVPLLAIDRGYAPVLFAPKTGVGMARKLGSDVVLGLWRAGVIRSPWIYHCDADTTLPATYFRRGMPDSGAVSFPFAHVPSGDAEIDRATFEYEARLRYHFLGLCYAGSPYAYHSLGSSLAVHAVSYAQVRGFPKRAAGEDFYLLDKVNKLDRVHIASGEAQQIQARRSTRVPFGTGAAVEKLLAGEALLVDTPHAYGVLRDWYQQLEVVIAAHDAAPLAAWLAAPEQTALRAAADELGALPAFEESVRETRSDADLRRRLHGWFDGLKALRLLHGLRAAHPAVPLADALGSAPFVPVLSHVDASDSARFWLTLCEKLRVYEAVSLPSAARATPNPQYNAL